MRRTSRRLRSPLLSGLFAALLLVLPPVHALDLPGQDKALMHYTFVHWTMDEGLPQTSVQALAQDQQGYIWVGTQAGLVRFDGQRFVAVATEPGALPDDRILDLHVTPDGQLLVATRNGLAVLDTQHWIDPNPTNLLDGQAVHQILALDNDRFLLASAGLPEVTLTGERRWLLDESIEVHSLTRHKGITWAGSPGAVHRIDGGPVTTYSLPASNTQETVIGLAWWMNQLWLATDSQLMRFDGGSFIVETLPPQVDADNPSISLLRADEQLWIGTFTALVRRDHAGRWDVLDRERFGSPPWPASLLRDREGNLWIGSQSEALTRARFGWTYRYDRESGLGDNFVWSVALGPDGTPWMGTNSGIRRFAEGAFEPLFAAEELPNPSAYSLYPAPGDRMFVGTNTGFAIAHNDAIVIPAQPDALAKSQVRAFLALENEPVLIGSAAGLFQFDGGVVSRHPNPELAGAPVRSLTSVMGEVWVGTDRGFMFVAEPPPHPLPEALKSAVITSMLQLDATHWLIGTYRHGLHIYDSDEGFYSIPEDGGLIHNSAFALVLDSEQRVWISSHIGLQQTSLAQLLDDSTPIETRMVVSSGGQHAGAIKMRCCNGAGSGKALLHEGRIWLPTLQGVIAVDTSRVDDNAQLPTVVIEELRLRSGEILSTRQPVVLSPEQRSFRLHFTGLSYRDPDGLRFRYRLRGLDSDWVEAGNERFASYTNVPPGEHVFEVSAANDSGLWNPNPPSLRLTIHPYWYERRLVHLAATLAVIALFVWWANWRGQRARRERERLEAHVAARTRDLASANERLDELNQQLAERSETDSLTGLRNRRFAMRQIHHEAEFQARKAVSGDVHSAAMAFVLVDLDHFKDINDNYGHSAGDQVLIEFGQRLKTISRASDYLIRWGGEEFLVVLRETGIDDACLFADRLLTAVSRSPFSLDDGRHIHVDLSAGIAVLPRHRLNTEQWERVVEMADFALYRAKAMGRHQWQCLPMNTTTDLLGSQPRSIQEHLRRLSENKQVEWRQGPDTA